MRRMRNNNLEIRIAGSSCRPQQFSVVYTFVNHRKNPPFEYSDVISIVYLFLNNISSSKRPFAAKFLGKPAWETERNKLCLGL